MKKKDKNLLWGALLVGGAYWLWQRNQEEADVGFYGETYAMWRGKRKKAPGRMRFKSIIRRLRRINRRLSRMGPEGTGRVRLVRRKRSLQRRLQRMGYTPTPIAAEDAAEMAGYIHQVRATAPLDHWRYR
jgi:hypothetical protein